MTKLITFTIPFPKVPTLHSLENKKTDYGKKFCQHNALIVDEERGMVQCKDCEEEMSAVKALLLLCRRIWWEENGRERQLEYDQKRVSKVQAAAFLCLFEAGITPQKFCERWEKENSKRESIAISIEKKELPLSAAKDSDGAA